MFFKLHNERKIGFKQLTEADLGRTNGHTTHIGLFGDILTFLPDNNFDDEAMFLYDGKNEIIPYFFERINRKNGDINAPRIRKGGKNIVSVTTIVQDIANETIDNKRWFLLWFGLKSEKVVFYLFNSESEDYQKLSTLLNLDRNLVKGQIDNSNTNFGKIIEYLERYVNTNTADIIQELEVVSQIGSSKKYKAFDLENANNLFKETGRKGEEIIENYFDFLKAHNQIFSFTWYNKSRETGLPYDFSVQNNNQNIVFIDVKSTTYKFEQPLIFSSQEIECITKNPNYHIYRVFDLSQPIAIPKLRICENSRNLANLIFPYFESLDVSLSQQQILLKTAKITVEPTNELLTFKNEILLSSL